jgi:hypothetical protein
MKIELELEDEVFDKIVVTALRDQYDSLQMDIKTLKALEDLPLWKQADLEYNLKMSKHIRKVLAHNGVTVDKTL